MAVAFDQPMVDMVAVPQPMMNMVPVDQPMVDMVAVNDPNAAEMEELEIVPRALPLLGAIPWGSLMTLFKGVVSAMGSFMGMLFSDDDDDD